MQKKHKPIQSSRRIKTVKKPISNLKVVSPKDASKEATKDASYGKVTIIREPNTSHSLTDGYIPEPDLEDIQRKVEDSQRKIEDTQRKIEDNLKKSRTTLELRSEEAPKEEEKTSTESAPEHAPEVVLIEDTPEYASEVAPTEDIPEIRPFAGKETRSTSSLLQSINNFVKGYSHVYTTLNKTNKKKLPIYALQLYKKLQAIGQASDDARFFIRPILISDIPNAEQVKEFEAMNGADDAFKEHYVNGYIPPLSELIAGNEATKFTRRYINLLNRIYLNNYERLSKDPVWKSILDESPLYMDDIIAYENSGRTDKGQFVIDLINQANTYGRRMNAQNNHIPTAEDALHMRGTSIFMPGYSTIDVIGKSDNLIGYYGPYFYLFLGHPTLSGPMETWWSLRIPLGVHVESSPMYSYSPIRNRLLNRFNDRFNAEVKPSIRLLNTKTVAPKWMNYPVHLIFYGNYDEVLPNFTVLTGKDVPSYIKYSKGYKQGGKLIPRKF